MDWSSLSADEIVAKVIDTVRWGWWSTSCTYSSMGRCSARDKGYTWLHGGMVTGSRSIAQLYGQWRGKLLVLLLLKRSEGVLGNVDLVVVSMVVDTMTWLVSCKQCQKQCSEDLVISFSGYEMCGLRICIRGMPKMRWCLRVAVNSREMDFQCSWIGMELRVIALVPVGSPSIAALRMEQLFCSS